MFATILKTKHVYVIHVRLKHGWQNIKINTLQECKVRAKLDGLLSSFLANKVVLFTEFQLRAHHSQLLLKTFESKFENMSIQFID